MFSVSTGEPYLQTQSVLNSFMCRLCKFHLFHLADALFIIAFQNTFFSCANNVVESLQVDQTLIDLLYFIYLCNFN